jgi:2-oxoglutarate dehydrogenase E1 component
MFLRQLSRDYRRPLVIFSPKRLLRHKNAVSTLEDFCQNRVLRVIGETNKDIQPANVKKVLFCAGQVYYDLEEERERLGRDDVAIARIEQFAPFPWNPVRDVLDQYPNAESVKWVQEEPLNMGAYAYVRQRMNTLLGSLGRPKTEVSARPAAPVTATGYAKTHREEFANLMNDAFN